MLQEMMGFFLGGVTPKVWFITAFWTGSICRENTELQFKVFYMLGQR